MKKVFAMAIILLSFGAFTPETAQAQTKSSTQLTQPTERYTVTISWDEWGRASRNCESWGLCNFSWGVSSERHSASVYTDASGQMYAKILIDAIPNDENIQFLIVDKDLTSVGENGNTYLIKKGEYPLDRSLGSLGGYKVGIKNFSLIMQVGSVIYLPAIKYLKK